MRVDKQRILKLELAKLGTHQEIADKIGVTRESISMMLVTSNKNHHTTSLNLLRKISKAYGKDLTWLASGDGKWN
jgi:transcriptional regulator with XRE-family HTH domain